MTQTADTVGTSDPARSAVKLISHNMAGVSRPDDLTYPWVLEAELSVNGLFMEVAAAFIYGSERIKIRGESLEALTDATERSGLPGSGRLRRCVATGPAGEAVDLRALWREGAPSAQK